MKKLITLRLDIELLEWAKKEAELSKRSLTQFITDLILKKKEKTK